MDKIAVFYLRDEKKFPVACVASMVVAEGENQPRLVRYAMSVYNHEDRTHNAKKFPYKRERAKEIALGRLTRGRNKARIVEIEAGEEIDLKLVEEIMSTTIRPQVKDACAIWLQLYSLRKWLSDNAPVSQADGHA